MNHISSRIYEDSKDLQIITDLIHKFRLPEHRNDYPAKVDVEEQLASTATRANTRLWFDDKEPIAWAFVDEFSNLWWELDKRIKLIMDSLPLNRIKCN